MKLIYLLLIPALACAEDSAVRRFSAGGVLSFTGFNLMRGGTTEQSGTNLLVTSTNQAGGYRFGGGLVAQFSFADRWAVAGNVILRRVRFDTATDTYTGTDIESTTADERKLTIDQDSSKATFWEYPVVLRRYSKSHSTPGHRWFWEGGMAFRRATSVQRSRDTTNPDGTTVCCDQAPLTPAHTVTNGLVAGAGLQFVDDFGVRIVPGVRYVRWLNPTFDFQSVRSNINQIEAGISLTF
jgi:hypothetical protein